MIKATPVVHDWLAESFLKLSPVDTCSQLPKEGKALGDQVDASIEYFSENKECNGIGWLLLNMVDNWKKEKDKVGALSSQLKIR